MARSLFKDTTLSFPGQEKYAGMSTTMSDNADDWHAQVLEHAYVQLPYLSEFMVDAVLDKVEEDRGYGYGSIMVRSISDQTPEEMAANPAATVHIPVIIRDGKMAPLDVYINDKEFKPLTEGRLRAALFRPEVFDAPRERPWEQNMYTDLQPPLESSTGLGGGGVKLGSEKTHVPANQPVVKPGQGKVEKDRPIKKTKDGDFPGMDMSVKKANVQPLLPKLAGRVSEEALERFKTAMTDDSLRMKVVNAHDGVKAAFEVADTLEHMPLQKIAEVTLAHVKPDTIQFVKMASGNVKMKWANADFYAPQEQEVDPMMMEEMAEDQDLVTQMETDGSVTLSTNAGIKETTSDEEVKVIDNYGLYAVQDSTGCELTGYVFPRVMNFDMVPLPLCLFTNGSQFALQEKAAGRLVGKSTELPAAAPQGYGAFYKIDGGSAQVFVPMHISSSFMGPDGARRLQATTALGDQVQICPTEGIKKPMKVDAEVCIPSDYRWMPLKGQTDLVQEPVGFMKTAMTRVGRVITDGSKWAFSGPAFAKLASQQTNFLDRDDAEFLLVAAGVNPLQVKETMAKVAMHGHLHIQDLKVLSNPQEKLAEARAKVKQAVAEAELPGPYYLWKEAAVLEDALTADKILGLGFLNPENVATFVEMLPSLETAVSSLAELLVASRLGMRDVPEVALERALVALDDTITGLRRLRAKEPSYL